LTRRCQSTTISPPYEDSSDWFGVEYNPANQHIPAIFAFFNVRELKANAGCVEWFGEGVLHDSGSRE
jgi:hypothetical protein